MARCFTLTAYGWGSLKPAGKLPHHVHLEAAPMMDFVVPIESARRLTVVPELTSCGDGYTRVALPGCSIRPRCPWFAQTGAVACSMCPVAFVVSLREERSESMDG